MERDAGIMTASEPFERPDAPTWFRLVLGKSPVLVQGVAYYLCVHVLSLMSIVIDHGITMAASI